MDTVRKQKSGDQLAVGDWLAPGELLDGAAEVLYVHSWPASADRSRDDVGKHVRLVVREQGSTPDYSDVVSGGTLFDLATEADLAALREQAQREQLAIELRQLANMVADPAMPVPQFGITMHGSFKTGAEVRAAAEVFSLPVESRAPHKGIQTVEWPQDRQSFEKGIHLHWLTLEDEPVVPAEPAPEPIAAHYDASAFSDECVCACGESFGDEAALGAHIADPTGLLHSRADDEPDDPTPVSGARVEPHVGGMTDEGLVDETPVEIRPLDTERYGYPGMVTCSYCRDRVMDTDWLAHARTHDPKYSVIEDAS